MNKDKLLQHISNGNIRVHVINEDLSLYKYTEQCVFSQNWDEITLACRGLVLDKDYNIVANCIPKFFNYEETSNLNMINLNQPFTVTEKSDGSLIQAFMHKGELILTSSGASNNEYTHTAWDLLHTTYKHLLPVIQSTDCVNFIFELIAPLTRVVVSYNGIEELRLITIRTKDGSEPEEFIQQCKDHGFDYVQNVSFNSIKDIIQKKQGTFENCEGFVVKLQDGNRIKFKYDEYFVLHKTITKATKLYVWEYLSKGISIDLTNIPDEAYDAIKQWESELKIDYLLLEGNIKLDWTIISEKNFNTRKELAQYIINNCNHNAKFLFALADNKDIRDYIWKSIKPKFDKH